MTNTERNVKTILAAHGMTFRKEECGEYRVNFKGGTEATAYYTDDLGDAHATALSMRARLTAIAAGVKS
jgi:hypothetical protein